MPDPTDVRLSVPPDLGDGGPIIMGIAQQIGAELDTLFRQVGPLHDFWQGKSQIGWQDLQTMWNNAANDLMTSSGTLGAISHTVQTNAVNYDNCETSNAQTWAH